MSTVFITGGSRGIGAAVARTFAYKGWSVAFSYLNSESEASDLQQELAHRGGGPGGEGRRVRPGTGGGFYPHRLPAPPGARRPGVLPALPCPRT